jgi:hypothetical protein
LDYEECEGGGACDKGDENADEAGNQCGIDGHTVVRGHLIIVITRGFGEVEVLLITYS